MNVADHLKRLEEELDLFDWREGDAPVWELARYSIASVASASMPSEAVSPQQMPRKEGNSDGFSFGTASRPDDHSSARRRLERFRRRLSLATKRNPLRGGHCDVALFGHPRRKQENGRWIDLYADPVSVILCKAYDVRLIEMDWNSHKKPELTPDLRYIDDLRRQARRQTGFSQFSPVGETKNRALDEAFRAAGIEIEPSNIVRTEIDRWCRWLPIYTDLLKKLAPRAVVLVNGSHLKALVAAARRLGIPSIELQHGSPAIGKLNYDFPAGRRMETFPDFFFSFGKFWTEVSRLPLPLERTPPVGFTYLRDRVSRFPEASDAGTRIMTISQPTCRAALAAATLASVQRTGGAFELLWKNHPVEEKLQDDVARALEEAGVRTLPPGADLYEAIASAGTIIGGYSTALYESVAFGRRPQIVKTGHEQLMSNLVAADAADLVCSAQEITFNRKPRADVVDSLFAMRSDSEILEKFDAAVKLGPYVA
ncbi:hypothetical protein [Roseibium sp. MMSF_3544]|uniref:hypothetical protein n=1 Tax=unclassified Roseibium TaxID=2629323 RepID=UPI00273EB6B2|nr:hypothetical protein [Roseibium sp. MMSF_3544]